jgi:hypothetical protein
MAIVVRRAEPGKYEAVPDVCGAESGVGDATIAVSLGGGLAQTPERSSDGALQPGSMRER